MSNKPGETQTIQFRCSDDNGRVRLILSADTVQARYKPALTDTIMTALTPYNDELSIENKNNQVTVSFENPEQCDTNLEQQEAQLLSRIQGILPQNVRLQLAAARPSIEI